MISVCIPTYKQAYCIRDTLRDVLEQTYQDFEIIISDDNSGDNILEVVASFNDPRIRFYTHHGERLNCGANQEKCRHLAKGEIIMLLSGKTRISRNLLNKINNAFKDPEVGAVSRYYYWFGNDLNHAVRAKEHSFPCEFTIDINFPYQLIAQLLKTVDNPGGIAYRKEFLDVPFNDAPFVEFTYPFVSIFKKHKVVLLSGYQMAVPAFVHSHSQDVECYLTSPLQNWVDLFKTFFDDGLLEYLIDEWAKNYIGLVQVRNYATWGQYFREIKLYIKYRPKNLLTIQFWLFSIGCLVPRRLLKYLVKKVKEHTHLECSLDTT